MSDPLPAIEETCCCGASASVTGPSWRAVRAHVIAWRATHRCPRRQAGDPSPGYTPPHPREATS